MRADAPEPARDEPDLLELDPAEADHRGSSHAPDPDGPRSGSRQVRLLRPWQARALRTLHLGTTAGCALWVTLPAVAGIHRLPTGGLHSLLGAAYLVTAVGLLAVLAADRLGGLFAGALATATVLEAIVQPAGEAAAASLQIGVPAVFALAVLLDRRWTVALIPIMSGLVTAALVLRAGEQPAPDHALRLALITGAFCLFCGMAAREVRRSLMDAGADVEAAERELEDATRRAAVARATRAETAEVARTLHDTAINTLGVIASGTLRTDPATVRARCRADVQVLRDLLLHSTPPPALLEHWRDRAVLLGLDLAVTAPPTEQFARLATRLPTPVLAALSGSVEELLVNAAKHAGTSRVELTVGGTAEAVDVRVIDRGRGFDGRIPIGHGLDRSVLARCHEAGISADVRTSPGAGTSVQLHWDAAGNGRSRARFPAGRVPVPAPPGSTRMNTLPVAPVPGASAVPAASGVPGGSGVPEVVLPGPGVPGVAEASAVPPGVLDLVDPLLRAADRDLMRALARWTVPLLLVVTAVTWRGRQSWPDLAAAGIALLTVGGSLRAARTTVPLPLRHALPGLAAMIVTLLMPLVWLPGCAPVDAGSLLGNSACLSMMTLAVLTGTWWSRLITPAVYLATLGTAALVLHRPCAPVVEVMAQSAFLDLTLLIALVGFRAAIRRQVTRAAADAAAARQLRIRQAEEDARADALGLRRGGALRTAIALLERIAEGWADPTEPEVRSACAAEESHLRGLITLDPELGALTSPLVAALSLGHRRGVQVQVRATPPGPLPGGLAAGLRRLLIACVATCQAGDRVVVGIFATGRQVDATVVGPPGMVTAITPDLLAAVRAGTTDTAVEELEGQVLVEVRWTRPD